MNGKLFGHDDEATVTKFTGRDTSPGKWFERTIETALRCRYHCEAQVNIGRRLAATKHIVDFVVTDADQTKILVSTKWQGTSGTGEDKVPFELMTLGTAVTVDRQYAKAVIVLGGTGWTPGKRMYYTTHLHRFDMTNTGRVECLNTDEFLTRVFAGKL